jgi:hypothetical protein
VCKTNPNTFPAKVVDVDCSVSIVDEYGLSNVVKPEKCPNVLATLLPLKATLLVCVVKDVEYP